jgi:PHP family Zn ribbon phosphoesterase
MKFIADLHIHSKYSRATSKDMVLEELDCWADDKGILVMGTGDFTHPEWFGEIKEKLEPAENGLFKLKPGLKKKTLKETLANTRFMLSAEISCIYSRAGKTRRVHHIVLTPDFETVEKINTQLSWIGNLKSDGRPILGLDSEELAKIIFEINSEVVIIPGHAWTPWFSVFGSMSGFDSLEECFGKYTDKIFAIETGLSSDPLMNWRLSKLDNIALISNSDSHSLERIGREANIFDTDLSYNSIIEAIKNSVPAARNIRTSDVPEVQPRKIERDSSIWRGRTSNANNNQYLGSPTSRISDVQKLENQHKSAFVATIEFFPEEGKYHYDGHLNCRISWSPEETKKHKGICSKCGRPITVGVLNRVDKLADRPEIKSETFKIGEARAIKFGNYVPFINLVTLDSIVGEALNLGTKTKAVKKEYDKLIRAFDSELNVLMNAPARNLATATLPEIVEGIERVRAGKLEIKPGFDGQYGQIKIFSEEDRKKIFSQSALF